MYFMKTTKEQKLFDIAESQGGLFTAQQAEKIGFVRTNHAYHVKAKHWLRIERGVYRLSRFPISDNEQLITYSLWSRNKEGVIEGVYSHETALSYYDLSDINPSKLYMTVPPMFRRSATIPFVLMLHRSNLEKADVKKCQGFSVTTPVRTFQDLIETQRISFEFIEQGIKQAITRGLARRKDIKSLLVQTAKNTWYKELNMLAREIE